MGVKERKQREKQARTDLIQAAAKKIFLQKGYAATTMEDIASSVELSVATIYSYFKNKGELYASLNLITLKYLADQIELVFNNKDLGVEEKIIGFKDAMYKTFLYEPLILKNVLHLQVVNAFAEISDELIEKINDLTRRVLKMMAAVLQQGVLQGIFRKGHIMADTDILWSTFTGLLLWEESKKRINPEKDYFKTTLDRAFDLLLLGLQKKQQS